MTAYEAAMYLVYIQLFLFLVLIIAHKLRVFLCIKHDFKDKYFDKGYYDEEHWLECTKCGKQKHLEKDI